MVRHTVIFAEWDILDRKTRVKIGCGEGRAFSVTFSGCASELTCPLCGSKLSIAVCASSTNRRHRITEVVVNGNVIGIGMKCSKHGNTVTILLSSRERIVEVMCPFCSERVEIRINIELTEE